MSGIPPVASVAGCRARLGEVLRALPCAWLSDHALLGMDDRWQLHMGKHVVSKLFEEGPLKSSRPASRLVGVNDAYFDSNLCLCNSDGFGEVGVVANDHRGIATLLEGVEERIGRNIDIGAFLFCPPDFDGSRTAGRRIHKYGPVVEVEAVDADDRRHPRIVPAVAGCQMYEVRRSGRYFQRRGRRARSGSGAPAGTARAHGQDGRVGRPQRKTVGDDQGPPSVRRCQAGRNP